jgi:hypothetical protein
MSHFVICINNDSNPASLILGCGCDLVVCWCGYAMSADVVGVLRPYRASVCLVRRDPGRCPGLWNGAPSGLLEPLRRGLGVDNPVSSRRPPTMPLAYNALKGQSRHRRDPERSPGGMPAP